MAVQENTRDFWVVLGGGLATGLVSLGLLAICLWQGGDWLAFSVPEVGIILFLGISMLGHYTRPDQAEAAIKHGLAASFVGAYFTVLGLSHLSTKGAEMFSPSLVRYLTVAVGAVVSFYFGATAAVQIAKK